MGEAIEISDEVYELYESIKDQSTDDSETEIQGWTDFVGQSLFIRTVTYHLVGKVTSVNGTLIELYEASWVADSGRFSAAIKDGTLLEVEFVGRCFVNASAITDCFPWKHELPKVTK